MYYLIILAGLALDRASKILVKAKIPYGSNVPVIDDFFYLTYHENKGAAWGILQDGRWFFIATTVLMLAVLFYMLARSYNRTLKLALTIIISGAIGNLIDRCIGAGGVPDFLNFYLWGWNFPTFNVADMCITCGSALLAVYLLFLYKPGDVNLRFFKKIVK